MDQVITLTYWSRATRPMADEELHDLLEKSRRNNARRGLTGLLLYRDQCFLQVIEGAEDVVESIIHTIQADPRHHSIRTLCREAGPRQFAAWEMGFQNLDLETEPAGHSDILRRPFDPDYFGAMPSTAQTLVLCFRGIADPAVVASFAN